MSGKADVSEVLARTMPIVMHGLPRSSRGPGKLWRTSSAGRGLKAASVAALHDDWELEARRIFNLYDLDGSGTIDPEEVTSLLEDLRLVGSGTRLSDPRQIEAITESLLKQYDDEGDGLSFEEFNVMCNTIRDMKAKRRPIFATGSDDQVRRRWRAVELRRQENARLKSEILMRDGDLAALHKAMRQRQFDTNNWGSRDFPLLRTLEDLVSADDVVIIEPWAHVGQNVHGEPVRASVNAALHAKSAGRQVACLPLHSLGSSLPTEEVAQALEGKTLVLEGGEPTVFDASSFNDVCGREYLIDLYKRILLQRHLMGPCVFICLSHQLVNACLVELVKEAICALREHGGAQERAVANEIESVGLKVQVRKHKGENLMTNEGFNDALFATARNEDKETEMQRLYTFEPPDDEEIGSMYGGASDPGAAALQRCAATHKRTAYKFDGDIEKAMRNAPQGLFIAMFHSDEVNWECAVFLTWALEQLETVSAAVPWLRHMPINYEIVASTRHQETGELMTEVAGARIDYLSEHGRKSSYLCQFHPELTGCLRDARSTGQRRAKGECKDGKKLLQAMLDADRVKESDNVTATTSSANTTPRTLSQLWDDTIASERLVRI